MSPKLKPGPGAVGAVVFTLLGLCFVNRAGIATDEAALEATLFRDWRFFSVPLFHHNVPVMELTYIGELKTWLYAPIFLIWNPTAASLRVPAILMGALTVLLFGALLQRVHGARAAWVGSFLLATDVTFLLTTLHDWGPVVLQHLLLAAVMLFAVQWFQTLSSASLISAAFCCGLAFWDKAVFLWIFSGLMTGLLVAGNILVMNQYLYQFIRNGEPVTWTDAVYPLAEDLKRSHASQILMPDWGITDALCVSTRDSPPTHTVEEPFAISDTNAIWVDHVPGQEFSKGVHERLLAAARATGFEPVMLKTYFDRNGRALFQSFQFKYSH